jgi:hypothetical protein
MEKHLLEKSLFNRITPALRLLRYRYALRWEGNKMVAQKTGLKEMPRAYLVGRFQVLPPDRILERTMNPSFDPRREVLLESDPGVAPSPQGPEGRVEVRDVDSDRMEITVETSRPTLLVITDNYGKGWKAVPLEGSDQKVFRVLPAYGFQRAVPLAPGRQHFLMEYLPAAFVAGKWISIVSWLVFLGLISIYNKRL